MHCVFPLKQVTLVDYVSGRILHRISHKVKRSLPREGSRPVVLVDAGCKRDCRRCSTPDIFSVESKALSGFHRSVVNSSERKIFLRHSKARCLIPGTAFLHLAAPAAVIWLLLLLCPRCEKEPDMIEHVFPSRCVFPTEKLDGPLCTR